MSADPTLQQLINNTPFLAPGDRGFLLEMLDQMNPLEKLKLKQSISSGQAPDVLKQLQVMRAKFFEKETPRSPDPITKALNTLLPTKPKKVLNTSILTIPGLLGGPIPQAIHEEKTPQLQRLADFKYPAQLSQLQAHHVNFNITDNVEQMMQNFLQKLSQLFEPIENITTRRSYFMNYLQSPLFSNYLNTGMTALRHPELEPAKVILNTLNQIDNNYLNSKQFQQAAIICNHLRNLCAL